MSKFIQGWQKASVLEEVFDQLSDALILYDPDFRITGVNRAAEKLFGMSSEELLGRAIQRGAQPPTIGRQHRRCPGALY
jgi:PAS domain S-box-containing protein